ncbi:MAG: RmuC-domain protein [candidate division WS6 bacterium GW2011_GWE1_34_7]|uniref:RmuC-domain protein n=1 Tax=candidate division WS6 bacterium GW2011_GWE1_34_7 TaxID=1619093 RepID=A0A0G0B2V5_9BACT|nr:MAG: RmuC-domain protein [candidate division WS6 bacterium GW2011_GWE1_34_7]
MDLLIALIGGLVLGIGIFYFFFKGSGKQKEEISETISQKLNEIMPGILDQANESLVRMADAKLGAESSKSRVDLENKRGEIERLVKVIQEELKESKKDLEVSEKERINSFSALKNSLDEYKKITEQLSVSTENLKKVLSNNQLRGQFGEQVADDLLKMAGFVVGETYTRQESEGGSRPDFTIYLPDRTKINVDAKFPYSALQKMTETDDLDTKNRHMRQFETDIKEKIKQVTSREYINPEDKTVDFVILFIPNEMIFSFIYDKMPSIWQDAMQKKVVLAGPFSFTAILRMVKQAYENFRIQENIYKIVGHVQSVEKEFDKFSEEFDKVGIKIEQLQKQYSDVSTTRVNQMRRKMDLVKLEGDGKVESLPEIVKIPPSKDQGTLL